MQKRIVTKEDLDNNPELIDQGINVGDEIEIPELEELNDEETNEDDPGGDRPKRKPDNP